MLNNKEFLDIVWKKYSDYKENIINDKFYKKHYYKNTEKNRVIRSLAMVMLVVTLGFGVTYAGTYIYEKIWKEPEKYNAEEIRTITPNEINESLTKEEAINIAKKITENLGKDFGNVVRAEMNKIDVYDLNWYIDTDTKISVSIDAKTGKLKQISDWGIDDTKIASTVSKEEAEKIAKQIYNELGYKDGEYELASLKKNAIADNTNLWGADFCKKYDGIYNIYQCVRITFIPEIKQLTIYTLFDDEFENNPIIISKEEAIEIAKNKALSMRPYDEIEQIEIKLDIRKMNAFVYSQEQSIIERDNNIVYNTTINQTIDSNQVYVTDETVRKVWVVEITYKSDLFADKNSYFIDCTTGEIIGGDSVK